MVRGWVSGLVSFSLLLPGPVRFLPPRPRSEQAGREAAGWGRCPQGCVSARTPQPGPRRDAVKPRHLSISAMASGNDGDPLRDWGRRGSNRQRPSQELNSEDQVAEETEEVFRSYAFYRYEQEREERGEEVPVDQEIMDIEEELGSTGSQVGQRLAIIGDDINKRYDAEFRCLLKSLQPTKENAYECFTRIASSRCCSHRFASLRRLRHRKQLVRERHQLGPGDRAAGLWLPHGHPRLPARQDRLPALDRPLRRGVHAPEPHRPVDRPAGRMGGCARSGQCLHEVHAGGGGPGHGGTFSGTTLLQALTEVVAEAGGVRPSSLKSLLCVDLSQERGDLRNLQERAAWT
ncbi:bcl-2 homologous antagonist/killer isoform X1 [Neopsephotus bourkii]|uniref:bcl-2 homologous antagonist/killer isoform X1 n=1 Tax=Neopsephotus bourkii TaxID=309878 RepID=UPI002AA56B03|nr:bcl-2 homologous antagonist/killer isoform X1 [Neopsephotus bourkii]